MSITKSAPVSPKVTASTGSGAVAIVAAYVLTLLPVLKDAPGVVQAAIVVLIGSAATFLGGYLKRDPSRI